MAPVKFGDIAKGATEVLNDDYQVEGYQFKSKLNTTLSGANATTAIDLWPAVKGDSNSGGGFGFSGGAKKEDKPVQTPAKITWKFPKPFGLAGVSVDKLEMTKSGDFAAEFAFNEPSHKVKGLSLTAKTDLVSVDKVAVTATFSGIADTRLQLDTKPTNPADFTFEVTKAIQQLTLGAKISKKDMMPHVGLRFTSDPVFAALVASEKFKKYQAYATYKINKKAKVAGSYEYAMPVGGKSAPAKFSAGLVYDACCWGKMKAKVSQDGTLSCSHKYQVSKGFSCLVGAKYNHTKQDMSWGCQVSVE